MFFKKNTKFTNIPSIFNLTASEAAGIFAPMYLDMKYEEIQSHVEHWCGEILAIYKNVKKGSDFDPAIAKLNKIMDFMQEYIAKPHSLDVIGGTSKFKGIKDAFYKVTFDLEVKIEKSTYKMSHKKFKLDPDHYIRVFKAIESLQRKAAFEIDEGKNTGFVPLGIAVASEVADVPGTSVSFAEVIGSIRRSERP